MSQNRIGVCTWSLGARDPADLIEALARVEVDVVQLALVPVIEDSGTWGDAEERLRDAGIEIASGMLATVGEDYSTLETIAATGGVRPDATWPETLERAERVADLAADRSIRLVTFHAGFIPHERSHPEREVLLDRLRTLADLYAARGIDLALETGQERAETLLEALGDLDRANVGVNFDPANMILYGMGDPVAAIGRLAQHVMQVHIKDALPSESPGAWGDEVPAGTGEVDWPAFFRVVDRIRPPVALVIEREAGATREADIVRARDLIRLALASEES